MKKILLIILVFLILISNVYALERCNQYSAQVRVQHWKYFGIGFPYHYGIGQLQQESNCKANITAFDGGQGIAQFMPSTITLCEKYLGNLDMYNPVHAIKAQAWYMYQIHKGNPKGYLWITYMFYNSGSGIVFKEYRRAGVWDYKLMKSVCKRKVLLLKNGSYLDLCQVGYLYPRQIYKYGKQYQIIPDGEWSFW